MPQPSKRDQRTPCSSSGVKPDGDDVYGLLKKYVAALAPGSHLILSQVTPDLNPDAIGKATEHFRRSGTPFHPRSLAEFARFFEGLELLGPGLIPVSGWRPDPQDVACRRRVSCRCTRVWPARPDSRRAGQGEEHGSILATRGDTCADVRIRAVAAGVDDAAGG